MTPADPTSPDRPPEAEAPPDRWSVERDGFLGYLEIESAEQHARLVVGERYVPKKEEKRDE